jgi:NTP pyrophosphatase (non-canonical NTP hydrolase)
MLLNEYQTKAETFHAFSHMLYPYFALSEEVGEFMGKMAKAHRGDYMGTADELDLALKKELGDVLWNVAAIASIRGWTLESVAEMNLDKLTDRKERKVIKGDGDNR